MDSIRSLRSSETVDDMRSGYKQEMKEKLEAGIGAIKSPLEGDHQHANIIIYLNSHSIVEDEYRTG